MASLNLLAVDINYVGLNENYDVQKELGRKVNKVWKYKQITDKICLDPEFDQDGLSESLSIILKFCSAQ